MAKKRKDEIVISFVGQDKDEVAGTCDIISYPKANGEHGLIVIECGLVQGDSTPEKSYNANKNMLDAIGKDVVSNCEFLIIGHSHIDHTGNLPYFCSDNGFKGKIIGGYKCLEIAKPLIKDSVKIHLKKVAYINRTRKKKKTKVKPLYNEQNMYDMFDFMEVQPIGEKIKLNEYVTIEFQTNNHTVGSTSFTIWIRKPNNVVYSIVYSSDMGSDMVADLKPFLDKNNINKTCNVFISEATYADKERSFTKMQALKERKWLSSYIEEQLKANKRILFATFSFGRCQELLSFFYDNFYGQDWFKEYPIYLDGILVEEINNVYNRILEDKDKEYFKKVISMNNLKRIHDCNGTMNVLISKKAGIYLAGSGFMNGGKIMMYLPSFLGDSNSCIIATGYCGAEGSIGYQLVDKTQKYIQISLDNNENNKEDLEDERKKKNKTKIRKNADIRQLKTWTCHIQYNELLKLFTEVKAGKILIHHSGKYKNQFAQEANNYLRDKGITTRVIAVDKGNYQFIL